MGATGNRVAARSTVDAEAGSPTGRLSSRMPDQSGRFQIDEVASWPAGRASTVVEIALGSTSKMLSCPSASVTAPSASRGRIFRVAISSRGNSMRLACSGSVSATSIGLWRRFSVASAGLHQSSTDSSNSSCARRGAGAGFRSTGRTGRSGSQRMPNDRRSGFKRSRNRGCSGTRLRCALVPQRLNLRD